MPILSKDKEEIISKLNCDITNFDSVFCCLDSRTGKGESECTKVDYELPEYRKTSFQIIVRTHTQKYLSGDAIARGIFKELNLSEVQLDSIFIKYLRPRHEPVSFRGSPGNNVEFSINFDICFVITDSDGY